MFRDTSLPFQLADPTRTVRPKATPTAEAARESQERFSEVDRVLGGRSIGAWANSYLPKPRILIAMETLRWSGVARLTRSRGRRVPISRTSLEPAGRTVLRTLRASARSGGTAICTSPAARPPAKLATWLVIQPARSPFGCRASTWFSTGPRPG